MDEAQAAAGQAIGLDSNYAPAHAYYSFILNDAQNWDQGLREAQTARQLDPTLIEAFMALGYSNESVGNYEGAIGHYKSALNINPNIIALYLRLGLNYRTLYVRTQQDQYLEDAIQAFSKALAKDPRDVEPYLALSRTYFQIDQLGTAERYLQQALTFEPQNPDILGRLGLIYFKRKNYEGAEESLRMAVYGGTYETDTGQTVTVVGLPLKSSRALEYYYTPGNFLPYNNKCDEARLLLQQALDYDPDNFTVKASYEESMAICSAAALATPEPGATITATVTITP